MDSQPLISCVIPTKNRPQLLNRAIDSIVDQTYTNVEIIVVASPPHEPTRQIVRENKYDTSLMDVVYIQDSSGPSFARNRGIENANGRYIAFLDDDDRWKPRKLEIQAEYIADHSIVSSLVRFQEDDKTRQPESEMPDWIVNEFDLKEAFCNYVTLYPSCVIMKKGELRQVGGFNEEFHNFGIWDLALRILDRFGTAYVIDEPLVIYQNTDDYDRLIHDVAQLVVDEFETYRRHKNKVPDIYAFEVGKQLGFRAYREGDGIQRYGFLISGIFNYFNLMVRGFPSVNPGE